MLWAHILIIASANGSTMRQMRADDLLVILVGCGVALTCFYIVSEYLSWQTVKASDIKAGLLLRELYKKLHSKTKPYIVRAIGRK
jgi:hypothetical protein